MCPVFLDVAKRDGGEPGITEKRQQVKAQPDGVTLPPTLAAGLP
jgi:hypothetical protein